ncbi:MAG: 5'-nucleotidase C-terminal domain-containing protein [Clostridia bacterium]|nr:5'-nucleotidase C-terminal domain-containing protein [Clostridia bacterium]
MMKLRLLSFILIFSLLLSVAAFGEQTGTQPQVDANKTITIIHTTDVHARVLEEKNAGMGYGKVAALAANITSESGIRPILVDAGDAFHGQTLATLERGESIVKIMNQVGYEVMTPGNHDFNYGQDRLLELASKATFKVISSNVKKGDGKNFLDPYVIIEREGIKFAFFGLSTPETVYKTNPNNVTGLSFTDPIAEAKAMVEALKGKADVIVCVSHLGLDASSDITSKMVAEKVSGIDLIIDGHSHTTLTDPLKIGNTLIVQTGDYLKNVGTVALTFGPDKKLESVKASLYTKEQAAELTPDEKVSAVINGYAESQKAILSEVIAKSNIVLDGERANVRTSPTNLSCLITKAMVALTGADAAITNGGGIRASIQAGNITRGDVITVLPFGNYIVTKKMRGSDILAALEHGLSKYPETNGAFPQVANIEYLFDASKPEGQRVTKVWIKGVKLDLNKEYTVATNDFMASGGDGYAFKDLPLVNEYQALDEALIAYITAHPESIKYTTYTIQKGDALWKIARKTGHSWIELAKINNLENPDLIYAGKALLIPAW